MDSNVTCLVVSAARVVESTISFFGLAVDVTDLSLLLFADVGVETASYFTLTRPGDDNCRFFIFMDEGGLRVIISLSCAT